jgi:hypothetical protein
MANPTFASKIDRKIEIFENRYSGIIAILKQTLLSLMPALFALYMLISGLYYEETIIGSIRGFFRDIFTSS